MIFPFSSEARRRAASDTSCRGYYVKLAEGDIAKGSPHLLSIGKPTGKTAKADSAFERKYGVTFQVIGCELPDNEDCLEAYNLRIFRYLDATYGPAWRIARRREVIGLSAR